MAAASMARHDTGALLRAHLAAAARLGHLTRRCAVCHRLLRLAMEGGEGPEAVGYGRKAPGSPNPSVPSVRAAPPEPRESPVGPATSGSGEPGGREALSGSGGGGGIEVPGGPGGSRGPGGLGDPGGSSGAPGGSGDARGPGGLGVPGVPGDPGDESPIGR
ncbi:MULTISPECIES: DUF6274 family protein [unclassified Streptomyces]|uniref:DUF6274 family protein n=1 Tax=unclassified Streptomyces TaxID=2593676 RepID=UPI0037FE12C4